MPITLNIPKSPKGGPPTHRLDATMIYISPNDEWDAERYGLEVSQIEAKQKLAIDLAKAKPEDREEIEAELLELEATVPWDTVAEHPVTRYASGHSRFDLSTVEGYVDVAASIQWKLRRIPRRIFADIIDEVERGRRRGAYLTAMQHAIVSVEGPLAQHFDLEFVKGRKLVREECLEQLSQLIGTEEFDLLGIACINGSTDLIESEKKR